MADFHDDFHGSALAHASFTVLQALHGAVGGGCKWRSRKRERRKGGRGKMGEFRTKKREDGRERESEREDDTVVNEHVHNTQD